VSFQNQINIAGIELYPIQIEGGVSPYMALGTMPRRPALLVRLVDKDGCFGWGEVWANFPPRAHKHKAHLIEDVITPKLTGKSFVEPREISDSLRQSLAVYFLHVGQSEVFEHILAGLDIALWDLALRKAHVSFSEYMQLPKASARVYASSININDLHRLVPHHASLGQKHFKLKIGLMSNEDRELVERAASLFPKGTRMMIDSNQMWNLHSAKQALSWLEKFDPLFAEEPLPANSAYSDWEALANATPIPLAGGENIYGIDNFLRMADAGMKVLQPDVAKWGGITGALELASVLPTGALLWPHFMGSAVGQMAALSVTAAMDVSSVCEMDVNENGLRTALCGEVMAIDNGRVELHGGGGLVYEPDAQRLIEWHVH